MRKKTFWSLIITILLIVVIGAACGYEPEELENENSEATSGDDSASEEDNTMENNESAGDVEEQKLLLGTSSQGGTYYVWGGGWADIMNENVPKADIAVEVTGGPTSNIQLIEEKDMELGFVTSWLGGEAHEGIGWTEEKYENFGAIFPMYPSVLYLYTLEDNPIESIDDFADQHISVGPPGSTSDQAGKIVLDTLDVEPSKVSSLPTNDAVDNLKDGIVDAGFAVTGVPGPFMLDLETTHNVRHIELNDEEIDALLEEYPFWSTLDIASDTYKDLEEDITHIAFWNFAVASKDLSDDLVYELVKSTFENQEELINVDPSAKDTLAENIVHSSMPLHPGAYKYYQEEGIDIPEDLIPPEKR
ncbi:TAXI family TRAP transporter solute-binding subunit [Salibacterium aidingense]|uniref:TAXI family TRAP transporter solute-binding subunit n=1 Tax=Salibacterium aidingense TaxID=384933 RepID=UPI003BE2D690